MERRAQLGPVDVGGENAAKTGLSASSQHQGVKSPIGCAVGRLVEVLPTDVWRGAPLVTKTALVRSD